MAKTAITVKHDPINGRFYAKLPHGTGETVYIPGEHTRMFVHTGVPEEDEGHGYGTAIIAEAVRDTVAAGLTVVAICPFVAAYVAKHPEALQGTRRVGAEAHERRKFRRAQDNLIRTK